MQHRRISPLFVFFFGVFAVIMGILFTQKAFADDTPRIDVKPGLDHRLLITGNIALKGGIAEDGQILIGEDGKILCIGDECATKGKGATLLIGHNVLISPGLINAHDHLNYDHQKPGDWGTERYDQRNDWRKGLRGHTQIPYSCNKTDDAVSWTEMRQVMAGTTSIAGSGGAPGLLRNLDRAKLCEGVCSRVCNFVFPLGDTNGVQLVGNCNYPKIQKPADYKNDCFLPHVSEGIDNCARNEFVCLSGRQGGVDFVTQKNAFIHGIALTAQDAEMVAKNKLSIVWSPRSNVSLYGNTAAIPLYKTLGINIALSTDWTPSGSMNLLREMRCAKKLNEEYFDSCMTDQELWQMVTSNAAVALDVDHEIGAFDVGMRGDIAIFAGYDSSHPYSAMLDASPEDVVLVMRDGKSLYGDADVMSAIPSAEKAEPIGDVCGVAKAVRIQKEIGISFADLQKKNAKSYPLYFRGRPDGEPTDIPARNTEYPLSPLVEDKDHDGVLDKNDNCPCMFNPIRPMDSGKQADADGDGVGDVCDPTPLGKTI